MPVLLLQHENPGRRRAAQRAVSESQQRMEPPPHWRPRAPRQRHHGGQRLPLRTRKLRGENQPKLPEHVRELAHLLHLLPNADRLLRPLARHRRLQMTTPTPKKLVFEKGNTQAYAPTERIRLCAFALVDEMRYIC